MNLCHGCVGKVCFAFKLPHFQDCTKQVSQDSLQTTCYWIHNHVNRLSSCVKSWNYIVKTVFFKLWSAAVCRRLRKRKHFKNCIKTLKEWKILPYLSVLKLSLLVDLRQKVGELVLSITSCPRIIILQKTLHLRFQVLTAASMMFRAVFWVILPCKMIVGRRFRGAYCLHHQGWCTTQKTALNIKCYFYSLFNGAHSGTRSILFVHPSYVWRCTSTLAVDLHGVVFHVASPFIFGANLCCWRLL
jgi:hypothetical protein